MKYFLLTIFLLAYQLSPATTFTVFTSGNGSIKSAVANAKTGDTIFIKKGIYSEGNILIQKALTIIGVNYPVLDGKMKYELLTIAAPNVSIEGLHIINSGRSSLNDPAGIKCLDANNVKINNNKFTNTFFGIHVSNSNYVTISNNVLIASGINEYELGNGIHLWKCNHANITNNNIQGHRDGIYFEFVTKSIITNNFSKGNKRYGLHFMFSHENTYTNNTFVNNGAGVAVMYTRHVKMIGNTFEENWGSAAYGLLLKEISDSEVLQNKFIGNTSGIYMEGTSRTKFEQNLFQSNGWGIKLQASCDDNTFTHNNFTGNTFDISTNGTLVLNIINSNYWDKYQGYDLNKDGKGDVPHPPVNLFSMIVERIPPAIMLWRSFLVFLLDRAEKVIPAITPENLKDHYPSMKPYDLDKKLI
jgi:nitrous oxidase accessory protein